MIGFCHLAMHLIKDDSAKRWPSDKANHIVVKMPCKLLYDVIQVKGSSTSWPAYLISEFFKGEEQVNTFGVSLVFPPSS